MTLNRKEDSMTEPRTAEWVIAQETGSGGNVDTATTPTLAALPNRQAVEAALTQAPATEVGSGPSPELIAAWLADLPDTVVVDQQGAYWRNFGSHYSMCVVSTHNDPIEVQAVYARLDGTFAKRIADEALASQDTKPEVGTPTQALASQPASDGQVSASFMDAKQLLAAWRAEREGNGG